MCEQDFNLNEENFAEKIEEVEVLDSAEPSIEETANENFEFQELKEEPISFFKIPEPTPEEKEKRKIKKISNAVGFSFLVLYVLIWVFNLSAVFLARTFNFENLFYEPAFMQVQQIIFSLLVFTFPFILIFKLYKYRISDLINFSLPKGKQNIYLFLIGIGFCSFANIASSLAERIFDRAGISYEVDFGENPEGIFGFMLSLLATVIVPSLVEEFACRGILLGALKRFGQGFAIITSAALFGFMHSNFEQIPFAFLVGLVLGYITVKSGTIWVAVFVHAFNNLISIVYTYFLSDFSGITQNLSYTIFLIVCLILGLFAINALSKDENAFKLDKVEAISPLNNRLKHFFLSVPIIIYISICILQSFIYFE